MVHEVQLKVSDDLRNFLPDAWICKAFRQGSLRRGTRSGQPSHRIIWAWYNSEPAAKTKSHDAMVILGVWRFGRQRQNFIRAVDIPRNRKTFISTKVRYITGVMLNQIRRWLAAYPHGTLFLLVCVATGPFLAKPFNIDDPLFIRLAQQVWVHPADPFGFSVNWYGEVWPMWTVTENPPLAGYYFALFGSAFSWSEIGLHLGGLLATCAVLWGTFRLAARFCGSPLLAAGAVLCMPIFLVSANTVMCDPLMLAFWIWAIVFWLEGLEGDRFGKIIAAGLLAALALLTKYFGVALLPLFAVHGLIHQRKPGRWMVGLLIPLVALGAYEWATWALYRHPLFSAAAGFATSVQTELGFSKLSGAMTALVFTGGGAACVLFTAPALWRPRSLLVLAGSAAGLAGALCASGFLLHKYAGLETAPARIVVSVQFVLWAVGGVLVLALAALDLWPRRQEAGAWLLACWVAGTFVFAGLTNWTVNGRSLLPMLPAVGILLVRRWESLGRPRPRALGLGLALSALLAFLVAQSDFQMAVAMRRSAEEALAKCVGEGSTVWFEGHWGFQYYLEKSGATAVDFKHSQQKPGDFLVLPVHNTDVSLPAPEILQSREVLTVPAETFLSTWCAGLGAGFYSSVVGPLPFAFGSVAPETVDVCRLKAPSAK